MNGNLALTVTLASHGNVWLIAGGAPPELFPDHPAFRFVERLAFVQEAPVVFSRR